MNPDWPWRNRLKPDALLSTLVVAMHVMVPKTLMTMKDGNERNRDVPEHQGLLPD